MHNLTLFAIGSGVGQYMDNSTSAGLGYGASLGIYKINATCIFRRKCIKTDIEILYW